MSKATHDEEIILLKRTVAGLLRRVNLLELYLSSERRERLRITADAIRPSWAKDAGIEMPVTPAHGAV
jgi:hypothetical protein